MSYEVLFLMYEKFKELEPVSEWDYIGNVKIFLKNSSCALVSS